MADWKRAVVNAVDEVLRSQKRSTSGDWRSLGRVTRLPEVGWYALDLGTRNGRPPSADSFDQLCLADKEGPERGTPIAVERSQITDGVLRVQIAGQLPEGCDILWTVRLSPQHLSRKLRDGIASIDTAPLADRLASGAFDPVPPVADDEYPPGFLPSQRQAYQACTAPGLHAVWGPPGTGKTRVLARAIEDHVKAGRRVLLVSTANIAVDNALKEVVKHLAAEAGVAIRVGAPHLAELANDDDVQLHRLAARTTAEADAQRQRLQEELGQLDTVDAEFHRLDHALADYDHDAYLAAGQRVGTSERLAERQAELRAAESEHERTQDELRAATGAVHAARNELQSVQPERVQLDRARELTARLRELDQQLTSDGAQVRHHEFLVENGKGGWLRNRRARRNLANAREALTRLEQHVVAQHAELEPLIQQHRAAAGPITDEYLTQLVHNLDTAEITYAEAASRAANSSDKVQEIVATCAQLERQGVASEADKELVASVQRQNLAAMHEKREELRAVQQRNRRDRVALEERLQDLNKRITRLRKDAEGEIVGQAKVVATTLARARAHAAVARQLFDVVFVDEAGAAVVGEVLLAVARATRTATLLGDFLQLGPVLGEVEKIEKPDVQKWLARDGFTHCGIRTPDDVMDNPGCVTLVHQFRFGPNLRRLANDVVYGVLKDGVTEVSGKTPDDTEIVLVDVHGLDELNQVHRSSRYAGWWPVGALLSRALVQHHATDPDGVGVVTTFRQQVEATHAALRDSGQNLTVPVGTAHAFQGREFDSVIFDLVEDGAGWINAAKWHGENFERNGVRLFGVGITRARRRLYVIANGNRAVKGAQGETPLGAFRRLGEEKRVQWCRASVLLGMADPVKFHSASSVEAELNEVLRGLVDVTDVHDEFSFDEALCVNLAAARHSLWMWSPWVGKKSRKFLSQIDAAVARNVDVRVFVRTERDQNMRKDSHRRWLQALRDTGAKVIRAEVEHRKIVVVDREVVLLGSHNPLSQHNSREVMITCRGAAFAERMLTELRSEIHGYPPVCARCGADFELWRSANRRKRTPYFWRCHRCKVDRTVTSSEADNSTSRHVTGRG